METGTYAKATAAAVGSALASALVVTGVDVGLTLSGGAGATAGQALTFGLTSLALALGLAAIVGAAEGIVAGAIRATHGGEGPIARLRRDEAADRATTGALLAFLVVGAIYALVVAGLSMRLVAGVERKSVGALLVGAAAAGALPAFVLLGYPVYRVTRRLAGIVPRLGRVPRAMVAAIAVMLFAVIGAATVVFLMLDWRVLPLATPVTALAFGALQLLFLTLRRRPWPPTLVAGVGLVGLVGAAAALLAVKPDARTTALLAVDSRATRLLVGAARVPFDRDGDGYATVLGGGDCDDRDARVHPGGKEIPDNGVDENCLGGDAHKDTATTPHTLAPPVATHKLAAFKGNLVVIAVDTLRFDRLGTTRRGGKSLTPNLDKLAARAVLFRRAYAQAPNTPRSFPSMFFSRFPSQIAWDDPYRNYSVILEENTSLWEVLAAAGVHTAGVASHFYFSEERGIRQGFAEFDNDGALSIKDSNADIAAPRIVPRALARLADLKKSGGRFALFVHLFEPHSTYVTHAEYPIQGKGTEGLEEKYDYEVAFCDQWLGKLLAGVDDQTAIVLVSDHGEAFGTHKVGGERMFFHGQTLYDELLHVPVMVAVPGVAPRTVDTPVMLVDVAPTVVDLMGATPPASFQGTSLVPALLGEALPARSVRAELLPAPSWNHDARALLDSDGKSKLYYRISENVYELYDLADDPDERKNLIEERRDVADRMKANMARWLESGVE